MTFYGSVVRQTTERTNEDVTLILLKIIIIIIIIIIVKSKIIRWVRHVIGMKRMLFWKEHRNKEAILKKKLTSDGKLQPGFM